MEGHAAMASSWLDTISCGAALVLAALAGARATGVMLQDFGYRGEVSVACRDADATAIGLLRPLVATEGNVDPHIFRMVVTNLDLARGHCRSGESETAMAIYTRLNDDLSHYTSDGAWPLDEIVRVVAEMPVSAWAAALRHIF
jgi:hypothetical protein